MLRLYCEEVVVTYRRWGVVTAESEMDAHADDFALTEVEVERESLGAMEWDDPRAWDEIPDDAVVLGIKDGYVDAMTKAEARAAYDAVRAVMGGGE